MGEARAWEGEFALSIPACSATGHALIGAVDHRVLLPLLVAWPVLSVGTGCLAHARGRSGIGWGLLAVILSPLLTFIILLCLGPAISLQRQRVWLSAARKLRPRFCAPRGCDEIRNPPSESESETKRNQTHKNSRSVGSSPGPRRIFARGRSGNWRLGTGDWELVILRAFLVQSPVPSDQSPVINFPSEDWELPRRRL